MIFTWGDASLIPQEQNVDAETARRWLRGVLEMTKHHSWGSYDMTNTHANWRAFFLANIGSAVRSSGLAFCASRCTS